MADSSVAITAGAGTNIDTFTQAGGDHRQAVVIGDASAASTATVNSAGALLMQGHQSTQTTGTITSAASTVGPVAVSNYNVVTVTIRGTYAGVNITFEASDDGTNFFPIMAARTDTFLAASTSGVITANSSLAWDIPVGAFTHFRVRSTAWTSGTANVGITAQSMPYEPSPTVGISGSVVNASGALLVTEGADPSAVISIAANATSSGSLTGLSGAGTAMVQLTGTFVATVQAQITVDGTNWVNVTGSNSIVNAATGAYVASGNMTAVGVYQLDIAGAAGVRVITTAYTSGTVAGIVKVGLEPSLVGIEGGVNVSQMNGIAVSMGSGVNGTGVQRVSLAIDQAALTVAGLISVKIDQTTDGTTNKVNMTPVTSTTTGNTLSSAATTNATSLKGSAGTVFSVTASNTGAAAAFLKLYNKATAPTVGTDVPVLTISLPASGTVNVPFGANGFRFATGIAYAITNLAADSDTTAVAAAQVKVMWSYI